MPHSRPQRAPERGCLMKLFRRRGTTGREGVGGGWGERGRRGGRSSRGSNQTSTATKARRPSKLSERLVDLHSRRGHRFSSRIPDFADEEIRLPGPRRQPWVLSLNRACIVLRHSRGATRLPPTPGSGNNPSQRPNSPCETYGRARFGMEAILHFLRGGRFSDCCAGIRHL